MHTINACKEKGKFLIQLSEFFFLSKKKNPIHSILFTVLTIENRNIKSMQKKHTQTQAVCIYLIPEIIQIEN